jgi:hypothetical protein
MDIFLQVMTLYGITFVISMAVAAIIWAMAKLINLMPDKTMKSK